MENTTISAEQWKEFNLWLNGQSESVPDFLRCQSNSMMDKIAFSMNSVINISIRRILHLQQFVEKAEIELYSEDKLLTMEPETIQFMYTEANKNLKDLVEFVRRYTNQNRELLSKNDADSDALRDMLLSLPKEKIAIIMDLLSS